MPPQSAELPPPSSQQHLPTSTCLLSIPPPRSTIFLCLPSRFFAVLPRQRLTFFPSCPRSQISLKYALLCIVSAEKNEPPSRTVPVNLTYDLTYDVITS